MNALRKEPIFLCATKHVSAHEGGSKNTAKSRWAIHAKETRGVNCQVAKTQVRSPPRHMVRAQRIYGKLRHTSSASTSTACLPASVCWLADGLYLSAKDCDRLCELPDVLLVCIKQDALDRVVLARQEQCPGRFEIHEAARGARRGSWARLLCEPSLSEKIVLKKKE